MTKLRSDKKNYLLWIKVETCKLLFHNTHYSEDINIVIREPIAKFLMRNFDKNVRIVICNVMEINKNVYHVLRQKLNLVAKTDYDIRFRKHDLKKNGERK